jgi:hypothetical protein
MLYLAYDLEKTDAGVAKPCLRYRTNHCKGCKTLPRIRFTTLQGVQKYA